MKASVKFREDQKPLFRAKVPLSILGLPFQSGIVAGESKELTLNLGTFFESGPSIRVAYRPNDTWNPFSLVVKTGTGSFGSPISSSMLMSAEFSLLGRGNNPRFMLHFKPRFGDFSIKKSQSSVFDPLVQSQNGVGTGGEGDDNTDSSIEVVDAPMMNGSFAGKKISILPTEISSAGGSLAGLFSGMEMTANTAMPVRGRAVVNFRWGVRFPPEIKSVANPTAGISFQKIPFLVMNKIGIQHVDDPDSKATANKAARRSDSAAAFPENGDVAEACFAVKRQLEALHAENGRLIKAVEDLREGIGAGGRFFPPAVENPNGRIERRSNEKKGSDFNGFPARSTEADVSEELKKALKGASGA